MINWKVATAIAAAATSLQPAYAADFIKYTFQTTGTGSLVTTDFRAGQRQSYSQVRGVAVSYILPITGAFAEAYTSTVNGTRIFQAPTGNTTRYQGGSTKLTAAPFTFGIEESATSIRGGAGSTVITTCGNFNGIFPVQSFNATLGCGAANISYSVGSSLDSYALSYTGVINQVDVELGTGTPPQQYGVLGFVTFVPEPSSWILMIAGFGFASHALRRRRHRLALA